MDYLDSIVCYVRKYDDKYLDLRTLSMMTWVYVALGLIALGYGIISKKSVVSVIIVTLVTVYAVFVFIFKGRIKSISYYQRFLITGGSSLFSSIIFLLLSFLLVEVLITKKVIYFLILGIIWSIAVSLNFIIPIIRIRKEKYSEGKTKQNARSIVTVSLIGSISGISFMKIVSKWMNQQMLINVAIVLFLVAAVLFTFGTPNLLKSYYVKKYDITGESIPYYRPKMTKKQKRGIIVLLSVLLFLAIMVIIGVAV